MTATDYSEDEIGSASWPIGGPHFLLTEIK